MLREQERPAFGGWLISDSKRAKITTIRSAVIREVINSKNKGLPAAGRQPAALIHTHDVETVTKYTVIEIAKKFFSFELFIKE